MSAGAMVRARRAAAQACGYRNALHARIAGDLQALAVIDAAQRSALRKSLDRKVQPMPTAQQLKTAELLDDRGVIIAALIDAGFPISTSTALLQKVINAAVAAALADVPKPAAQWTRWTDQQLAVVQQHIDAGGGRLPSAKTIRQIAEQLGRSPRSIQSAAERMIAGAE